MKRTKRPQRRISDFFTFLFIYFIFIFSFLSLFSSGVIESEDGWLYLNVARNIYYKHNFTAPPQTDYPLHNVNMNSFKGTDGQWRAPGSTGYSLALVPAVALSDVVHRYYHSTPPLYFPLDSDWSLHFFASFTNIFIMSVLSLLLVLYGLEMNWSKKNSIAFSFFTIFCTNLLPMAKFGFAQVLFTFFLMLTFFLIKKYVKHKTLLSLMFILLSFYALTISYNISFYLTIIPLILYYIFLHEKEQQKREVAKIITIGTAVILIKRALVLSLLPALRIFPSVLFEGVWGFLFSSGKSLFLFSPPLLLIPLFWQKIRKDIRPELIAFGCLALLFIVMLGSAWIPSGDGKGPIWHGGMGWGPRYMTPLIPGLMLIVFSISHRLSLLQKKYVFLPLLVIGLIVQILGASITYLLQYRDLPYNIFVQKQELSVYDYASFIPRYSPLLTLPHVFISLATNFPDTVRHGEYNVKLYDGFDTPLRTGGQIFRGFREEGRISFVLPKNKPLQSIQVVIENVPDKESSTESAVLSIKTKNILLASTTLPTHTETLLNIPVQQIIQDSNGFLVFEATYATLPSSPHVIYIKKMIINDSLTNLGSLDYPDVSSLGKMTSQFPYEYYGNKITDLWTLWNMRARLNEQSFDFWWIKNLYFWDRPKKLIYLLLGGDLLLLGSSVCLLYRRRRRI